MARRWPRGGQEVASRKIVSACWDQGGRWKRDNEGGCAGEGEVMMVSVEEAAAVETVLFYLVALVTLVTLATLCCCSCYRSIRSVCLLYHPLT